MPFSKTSYLYLCRMIHLFLTLKSIKTSYRSKRVMFTSLMVLLAKKNFNWDDHSFSLAVTRCITCCHSLSIVVPLIVIKCHSLYTTRCYSLSLDILLVWLFINDPKKTSQEQKKAFACALQNETENLTKLKMWNPTSANLICDFIKMVLHHKHISTFSFGKAISVNSSDYLWGLFICLVSQIKYLLFWKGGARPTHETETFTESCSRKNCSEKFHKFYRKEYVILEKSFLDKLQSVF